MRLEDDIHQELKIKMVKDGVSVQSFIKNFIEIYLESGFTADEILGKIKK